MYHITWEPASTQSEFVTAVKLEGKANDNDTATNTPEVHIRDTAATVSMTAEVTGGTSGTVKSWAVTDSEGTDATAKGVTVTPGDDGKSAVVNVAATAVRGVYTITAVSTDAGQGEEATNGVAGSATLKVKRAVVDTMTISAPSADAAQAIKMGDEPVEVVVNTTFKTADDAACIIMPAEDAHPADVTFTLAEGGESVVTLADNDEYDGKATLTPVGVGSTTLTVTSTRNGEDGQPKTATLNVKVSKGDVTLGIKTRNVNIDSKGREVLFKVGTPGEAANTVLNLPEEVLNAVTVAVTKDGSDVTNDVNVQKKTTEDTENENAPMPWNYAMTLPENTSGSDEVYTVTASFAGTDNYNSATDATATFTVVAAGTKTVAINKQSGQGGAVKLTSGDELKLVVDAAVSANGELDTEETGNLTFVWKKDGTTLGSGITDGECTEEGHQGHRQSTYTVAAATIAADAGTYTCVASTADGKVSSNEVTIRVEIAQKAGTTPTGVDFEASTRVLSGVKQGWKYSVEGDVAEKYREIAAVDNADGNGVGTFTIPSAEDLGLTTPDAMAAVTGIHVIDPGDAETKASAPAHISLTRATKPTVKAGDKSIIITGTSNEADYLTNELYRIKESSAGDDTWAKPANIAATEGEGTGAVISGLTNGTSYDVKVAYGGHVLGSLEYSTATPAEPPADPETLNGLKTLIKAAKNKVIGIWYADNAADVLAGSKFVSTTDGTTYNTAIKAAETVANAVDGTGAPTSTATEVNNAKAALQTAMDNFDALEKKDGTKKQDAFILNVNEIAAMQVEHGQESAPLGTVDPRTQKGYFTIVGNRTDKGADKKAKVEVGDALFADGFYGHQRLNVEGKVETSQNVIYKAVKVTTQTDGATVKVWVRNGGSDTSKVKDRTFGAMGGPAAVTAAGPVGVGQVGVLNLTLPKAGTYYLGGIDDTLHIFRMEVAEPGVDPNPASYDITVAAAENGTVKTTVGGQEADTAYEGDEVTIVATPANTGFEVDTITVKDADNGDVTVTNNKFTMPAKAVTVTVTFKSTGVTPVTSAITKAAATNGSFTVKVGDAEVTEAAEGSTVVITPTAAQGYEVDAVTTTPAATVTEQDDGTYTFPMPGEAVTVTVTFKEVQVTPTEHNITVTAGEHGTATASAAKAVKGTEITLTITPEQGYEVDQITSADVTVANNKFTMPDKDVAISVTFKQTQTPTPSGVHTFESKTLTQAAAGSAASGAYAEDNYFTLVPSTKTKYDQSNKEWKADTFGANAYDPSGDNAVSKVVRFNMGGATKADGPAIKFTTAKDNAKVQIWWVQGGGDTEDKDASGNKLGTFTDVGIRQIALMKTDATVVKASTLAHTGTTPGGEGRIKANDPEYTELTVDTAGTYMIGSAEGSNYIFKIVVTEDAGTTPTPTEHNITVTAGEHGTATASAAKAVKDTEITLTITPEQGYEVDQITSADVTVANNKFTMPDKDVAISVTFKATTVTPPQVDKTALNAAITAAEAVDVTGVKVSEDGADVPTTEKWIAKSVKDAFDAALADAKAVADDADQATVDAAATALTEATTALTEAIENAQNGTKPVDKADLTAAIEAAEAKMEGVLTSTNGKDVDPDKTWVTKAVMDALTKAVADAKAVVEKEDATETELTEAAEALAAASEAFVPAAGTKTSTPIRPSHGGGSVSTPVSDKKTETLPDGTKRETETAKDGTVTVTDTLTDGTKTVTVTTPEGESTTTVTLGRGTESVQVSIPVEDATSGMVAVIVKPDGTEEIIRDSAVVNGEVVFELDKDATVKVVDKSKSFVDVPGHWAESDVNFVAARDLFNGVSSTHFAPDATMTRGMMATVLFRLDGETKADKAVDFSDVTVEDWFAEAVDWAAEEGVITGYTDGSFGPDRSITREELVVMIYRYAGASAVEGNDLEKFDDADAVSDWATAAMTWAVQNGIIQGKGNNVLDPKGNASRAEVSAVLQRYVRLSK